MTASMPLFAMRDVVHSRSFDIATRYPANGGLLLEQP